MKLKMTNPATMYQPYAAKNPLIFPKAKEIVFNRLSQEVILLCVINGTPGGAGLTSSPPTGGSTGSSIS